MRGLRSVLDVVAQEARLMFALAESEVLDVVDGLIEEVGNVSRAAHRSRCGRGARRSQAPGAEGSEADARRPTAPCRRRRRARQPSRPTRAGGRGCVNAAKAASACIVCATSRGRLGIQLADVRLSLNAMGHQSQDSLNIHSYIGRWAVFAQAAPSLVAQRAAGCRSSGQPSCHGSGTLRSVNPDGA